MFPGDEGDRPSQHHLMCDLCVAATLQMQGQSCLAHVLSRASACPPWHYNVTSPASMKASMPLVINERDKEVRDTVDP